MTKLMDELVEIAYRARYPIAEDQDFMRQTREREEIKRDLTAVLPVLAQRMLLAEVPPSTPRSSHYFHIQRLRLFVGRELGIDADELIMRAARRGKCDIPDCEGHGVIGNENIIDGKKVCDYCHAKMLATKECSCPTGHANSKTLNTFKGEILVCADCGKRLDP